MNIYIKTLASRSFGVDAPSGAIDKRIL